MLHYGVWLLWTILESLNFYDLFYRYCSNLLKKNDSERVKRVCAFFFLFVKEHQRRQVSLTNGICTPGKKPTRRSVEHSTPMPMAPHYISLAYLIY